MKSFGIWYSNKNTQKDESSKIEEKFQVDLHINLWDIGLNKDNKPFIDIGLNILNFKEIDKLCIQIPFILNKDDIKDLTDILKEKTIANLIFNDDCIFQSDNNNICSIKLSEDIENPKVLYQLSKEVKGSYKFERIDESQVSIMNFDLTVIRKDSAYEKFNNLYMRFRIQSDKIKEELFCNVKRKNWFLESGFNKTQIIDIKINKKRNMPDNSLLTMRRKKFELLELTKIHFLVIEPVNHEIEILGNDFIECRKLENEWKEYLNLKPDFKIGDLLAYHWKVKKSDKILKEYSKMVKVTSATTTWFIIVVYIIVVIIIGVLTNTFFTYMLQPLIELFINLLK